MNRSRNALNIFFILLTLIGLTTTPRFILGYSDLRRAQALSQTDPLQASLYYESAAERLIRPSLFEPAAQTALQGADNARALELFLQAKEKNNLSPEGFLSLGDAYLALDQSLDALAVWENLRTMSGAPVEVEARLAALYESKGEFARAIESLQRLINLQPENAQAFYRLGLIMLTEDINRALPNLIQAATLDKTLDASVQQIRLDLGPGFASDDASFQLTLAGRALGNINEWTLATRAFRNAVNADNNYAEAWAWLGVAGGQIGLDGAAYVNWAVRLAPDSPSVRMLNGLYWQRSGDFTRAVENFKKAVELEPNNPVWWAALANALAGSGKLTDALAAYAKAVELVPDDPKYFRLLALFCADYDLLEKETGIPAAVRARELDPKDPENLLVLGRLYLDTGMLSAAEIWLKEALSINPDSAPANLYMGMLHLRRNNLNAAYVNFIAVQKLDPDGDYGKQAAKLLEKYFPY